MHKYKHPDHLPFLKDQQGHHYLCFLHRNRCPVEDSFITQNLYDIKRQEYVTNVVIYVRNPLRQRADRIGQDLSKFINSIYSFILAGGKSGHFLEEKAEILHRRESEFSYDLAKRFL